MAVTSVYALKRGRSGSAEWDKFHRSYVEAFMVVTDDPLDGPQVARTAIDPNGGPVIPQPGTFYIAGNDLDLGCFVKEVEAHEVGDSGLIWEVTVTAESWNGEPPKPDPIPTLREPEISWSFAQFQKVAEKDVVTGDAITNSAGQAFDPPIQIDDSRPVYVCERNEEVFNPNFAFGYKDAINSDEVAFGGLAVSPGQAKMSNIAAHREYENNQFYWKVTYEIHVKEDGWKEEVLDQGRYQKDPNGGNKLAAIKDTDSNPVTDPVPLDGQGAPLPLPLQPGTAVFKTFNVYEQLPFSALALP